MQPFGGPRRDDPGQPIAGADRMDLGGAGRDDDLVRMDVEHARAGVRTTIIGPA